MADDFVMNSDFSKNSDRIIRQAIDLWSEKLFADGNVLADINAVLRYAPLVQMASSELAGRFMKRTTLFALGIAALSLVVSLSALYVASTSPKYPAWLHLEWPRS